MEIDGKNQLQSQNNFVLCIFWDENSGLILFCCSRTRGH